MSNNSFKDYEKRISKEFEDSSIFTEPTDSSTKSRKSPYFKICCFLLSLIVAFSGCAVAVGLLLPSTLDKVAQIASELESAKKETTVYLTQSANVALKDMKNAQKGALSNVSSIYIKNETDEFNLKPQEIDVTNSDGSQEKQVYFTLQNYNTKLPIDVTIVNTFKEEVFALTAIKKLDGKYSQADCGLDKPKIFVSVKMADGTEFSFKIGNQIPTDDGYFYVSTSLADGIYIGGRDTYNTFSLTMEDLINTTLVSALDQQEYSSYFSNGTLSFFDTIGIDGKNFSDYTKLEYRDREDEATSFYIVEPTSAYASDEAVSKLLTPLSSGLLAEKAYSINTSSANLKKYGLTTPYLTVNYKVDDVNLTLKFSEPNVVDTGMVACMVNDIPVIYAVSVDNVEFIDWENADLRFSLLYLKSIQTFKTYTVEYGGRTFKYNLSFDYPIGDDGKIDTETSERELSVILGTATPIEAENFQTAYQRLALVTASKYLSAENMIPENPTLKFIIELSDGKKDVITFTKYNENYYLRKLNGVGDELIAYRTVDSLIHNYEKLRKGQTVISPNNQQ